ncbi:MAG: hypothetical protein IJ720_05890 [Clostridia bacterium]|nr:hypothetical protein [Clostridia bacterium]MBR1704878.1 hypothetical protein [Clostridia bacterium]
MRKLKEYLLALNFLKEWKADLEDAYAVAEENEVRFSNWLGALEPEVPVEKKAVILDLAAYRTLKASA